MSAKLKMNSEAVNAIKEKIGILLSQHASAIEKSWRGSDSNKYTFGVNIAIHESTRDGDNVLIITPTLSYSEKHKASEEIVIDTSGQLKLEESIEKAG